MNGKKLRFGREFLALKNIMRREDKQGSSGYGHVSIQTLSIHQHLSTSFLYILLPKIGQDSQLLHPSLANMPIPSSV